MITEGIEKTTAPPFGTAEVGPLDGQAPRQKELLQDTRQLQQLIEQAQGLRDPVARAVVQQCLQALLAYYGDSLARILQVVRDCGADGQHVFDRLANDHRVRALLLIHGLHPLDLPIRLQQAVDKVRPYMRSHGGDVELLSLENDFARFRLQGACETCPSSSVTMELALRSALEEVCPDLMGFEVESAGATKASDTAQPAHLPHGPGSWTTVERLPELADGTAAELQVLDVHLILAHLNGNFYAYRNACPECASTLESGILREGKLQCLNGHSYDVRHAGRAENGSPLHLDPFPLLMEGQALKVAVGRSAPDSLSNHPSEPDPHVLSHSR